MNLSNLSPLPSITTVVATKQRPQLLRRALRSILGQDYRGTQEVVVVFDQDDIDPLDDITTAGRQRLRLVRNSRTPGLAGGRNTGIDCASGDLIAFCDDDDEWLPEKLSAQVALWRQYPDAAAISCGITIVSGRRSHNRVPAESVSHADFLRSRVAEVHTSSLLMRREDVSPALGFVDEELPASYGEDYDTLLALSAKGPIRSVQAPHAVIHWDRPSFFAEKWQGLAAGLTYLLSKHPELTVHRRNAARMQGQIAFAHAAAGERAVARMWAHRAIRARRWEPRAWAAMGVASGVISPSVTVRTLNKLGRGV